MKLSVESNRVFVACAVLIALTISPSRSQLNLKLGGGIGVASPASDFGGSTLEYYAGSRFGLSSGLNLQAKAKLGFAGFNLTGEIDYASYSNSGDSEPGQGTVDISQKVLSLKVGPEVRFSPPGLPLTPYIGANIALNNFSGETKFLGVANVSSGTYAVESASRIGVGFSAGMEVSIGPLMTLDLNISYNMMNAFGSSWDDVNSGTDQRLDSYLSFNDARDPLFAAGDDKHFISNNRNVHTILFTASILFGL